VSYFLITGLMFLANCMLRLQLLDFNLELIIFVLKFQECFECAP
jgi:hypothetical protein